MKTCPSCRCEKALSEYNLNRGRGDGYQSECKSCKRARDNARYAENKVPFQERKAKQRKLQLDSLFAYLTDHPCVDCGESDILVLDFDHIGLKTSNVSTMIGQASWASILKEIEQCEVRCGSCHRRVTQQRANTYRWRYANRDEV